MSVKTNSTTAISDYVILISYDAFAKENWQLAASLPNMAYLLKKGAFSNQLKSVNPSLTYSAHTTVITGVYADAHGIIHNNPFQPFIPESEQTWYWYHRQIKAATLYDQLAKEGKTTAALLWPVTAGAKIQYNLPEIRAIKQENQVIKVLRNGSFWYCLDLERRFGSKRRGIEQPYLDDFTTLAAAHTILKRKPNLLLMHLVELDEVKHHFGTGSSEVEQVIRNMDVRLGKLIAAVQQAGISERTTIILFGDHSQINLHTKVFLNRYLKMQGYVANAGDEKPWKAWFQSTGGGAYLHLAEGEEQSFSKIVTLLEDLSKEETNGIGRIFSGETLQQLHMNTKVSLFVEAKPGYCFDDDWHLTDKPNPFTETTNGATHGYLSDQLNYTSNLILTGEAIRSGTDLGAVELLDIAPTIAYLFGIDFPQAKGQIIKKVFR